MGVNDTVDRRTLLKFAGGAAALGALGSAGLVSPAHGAGNGFDQVRRRDEPELVRVPDVEVPHFLAALLNFSRFGDDIPDGVGKAVNPPGGANGGSRGSGHPADVSAPCT